MVELDAGGTAGTGGAAGSVAARTAQVAVRDRATRKAVNSQRRNAVLNIVERSPREELAPQWLKRQELPRRHKNGNRAEGWGVFHRKVEPPAVGQTTCGGADARYPLARDLLLPYRCAGKTRKDGAKSVVGIGVQRVVHRVG